MDDQCPSGPWRNSTGSIFRRPQRKPAQYRMYNWCEVMLNRGASRQALGKRGYREGWCDWKEWWIIKEKNITGPFAEFMTYWCWAILQTLMWRRQPSCCNWLGMLTASHSDPKTKINKTEMALEQQNMNQEHPNAPKAIQTIFWWDFSTGNNSSKAIVLSFFTPPRKIFWTPSASIKIILLAWL